MIKKLMEKVKEQLQLKNTRNLVLMEIGSGRRNICGGYHARVN